MSAPLAAASAIARAPFAGAAEHLAFELDLLALRLERQVHRLRAQNRFSDDPFRGLYISDAQADALLGAAASPTGEGAEALAARIAAVAELRRERLAASAAAGIRLPLADLAAGFGLGELEWDLVLIALAPEVDLAWESLYAYAQNDVTRRRPTVQLALDLVGGGPEERLAARACLAPEGALLACRLLRLGEDGQDRDPPLTGRYLKLEERVAEFLLGVDSLDRALLPFVDRVPAAPGLGRLAVSTDLLRHLRLALPTLARGAGVAVLEGPRGSGRRAAAAALAGELGRPLLACDLARLLAAGEPPAPLVALLAREARLRGAAVLVERFEAALDLTAGEGPSEARLAALARGFQAPAAAAVPLFLATEVPWEPGGLWSETPTFRFAFSAAGFEERLLAWRHAVAGSGGGAARDDLAEVAGKFQLAPLEIRAAARRAAQWAAARGDGGRLQADDLHAGARALSRAGLSRLAQKVETPFVWDDLVLPRRSLVQLREVSAAVRHRARVHDAWGFASRLALGKGLAALFAGPSGTGKTMAASILAGELGLDLYKIDLASVVSKYIGETEKNLARIFAEAERSNAVLFFDEADALFGKRSEVRDAHDRYANIEVAYLLQRMEEHTGIVVLATNLKGNLDDAFARRLQHVVEFPAPDRDCRTRIWRRIFPAATPLDPDVDLDFLARQFELAGGNIKNIALAAAFLAAEEGSAVRMEHLILATSRELQKQGRLPTKSDFREHYELIREKSA